MLIHGSDLEMENFELMKSGKGGDIGIYGGNKNRNLAPNSPGTHPSGAALPAHTRERG
jgi:hypothetical protein